MAMRRFDKMLLGFKTALENSKKELLEQGYCSVEEIYDKILSNGGIKNYLR